MFISHNHSLLSHNTFGLDVKADVFAEYESVDELRSILRGELFSKKRFLHIGIGSNLLFTGDFHGTVLHSAIRFIRYHETEGWIVAHVGAGVVWDDFCRDAAEKGLWGVENLSGIPGEVGASAVQNIGAYGVEVCDTVYAVETIDCTTGEVRVFSPAECGYGYRYSIFKEDSMRKYIVIGVKYLLTRAALPKLDYAGLKDLKNRSGIFPLTVRDTVLDIRNRKLPDPRERGSAGSFFKNPVVERCLYERLLADYPSMPHYDVDAFNVKIPAAWMIEQCGLKGYRYKGAQVYEKQPLVIVNNGNATASDIVELAQFVCQSVKKKFGIDIYPEVNYI